ncbi:histidinol dehydrogenase, partial [Aerococcus urinae]|nr:histidinol dehydrogenase [Aerococcus urinae]
MTSSEELADGVEAEIKVQAQATTHTERILTALSGPQSGIVLVDDVEDGLTVVNAYGAEHLEVQTLNSRDDALKVKNAGA